MQPQLDALLSEGAAVTESIYESALGLRRKTIEEFDHWASEFDAILTLPSPGEGPFQSKPLGTPVIAPDGPSCELRH